MVQLKTLKTLFDTKTSQQQPVLIDKSLMGTSSEASTKELSGQANENRSLPSSAKNLNENDPEAAPISDPKQQAIDVPDGGYGWFVVGAIFLFNFCTWGANSGFAIYLAHYLSDNTFEHASQYDYSLIGGLALGLGMTFAPLVSLLVGFIGTRPVIMIGNCCQLAAMLMASFAVNLWELYLTQGVLISFGLALIAIPNLTLLPQWFRKRRTLAQGIAAGGSGGGGILFNLAMEKVMQVKSYKWALRTQAIICFCLTLVGILLTRTRNKHIKPEFKLYDKIVMRTFGFWVECLWLTLTMFGYVVLLYNLADFTLSLGYTSHQGSVVAAMVSVGALVGRPLVGVLSDKFGAVTVSVVVHFLVAVFCFAMWIPARNYATAIAFALIEGSMMGSIWLVVSTITARIVGLKKMNVAFSMLWIFLGCSCIVSPVIGIALKSSPPQGETSDPSQYLHVAIFVGFSYFGASLCLFVLRGWIIARDHLGTGQDSDNGGELGVTVSPKDALKYCFSLETLKNV